MFANVQNDAARANVWYVTYGRQSWLNEIIGELDTIAVESLKFSTTVKQHKKPLRSSETWQFSSLWQIQLKLTHSVGERYFYLMKFAISRRRWEIFDRKRYENMSVISRGSWNIIWPGCHRREVKEDWERKKDRIVKSKNWQRSWKCFSDRAREESRVRSGKKGKLMSKARRRKKKVFSSCVVSERVRATGDESVIRWLRIRMKNMARMEQESCDMIQQRGASKETPHRAPRSIVEFCQFLTQRTELDSFLRSNLHIAWYQHHIHHPRC